MTQRVWFVTGASKGFGLILVKKLLEKGCRVAATSRSLANLRLAAGTETDAFLPLECDLTDEKSVASAVNAAAGKFGRIDVVLNNAGYGQFGYAEEISDELARKQFDVNFFGALNVIRRTLPYLRKQRAGHIINLSSMAGFTGFPGSGLYSASKFALAGLSESLRDELAGFGIKVSCVKPGNFRTEFLADSMKFEDHAIDDYAELRDSFHTLLKKLNGKQKGDPYKGADVIISIADMDNPPLHFFLGPDSQKVAERKIKKLSADLAAVAPIATDTNYPE